MRYDTVIFDFDGTLCDTGEGIQKSAAFALDAFQIAHDDWEKLGFFMGPPLLITFQEKYGVSPSRAEELVAKFRERYGQTGIWESTLFDGVFSMLKSLKAHGAKIGIASSKPQSYIEQLLARFKIAPYIDTVCGVTFQADCEPKAEIIARCAAALGVTQENKSKVLVVGDTKLDADGANANDFDMCGVSYGYGSRFEIIEHGAKFMADKPDEVEAIALGFYEQTVDVRRVFDGKIIHVHHDDVVLSSGKATKREIVAHPGGVGILCLDDDGQTMLVRQFRAPYKELVYEIPAGKLEPGEDPLEAGKREFSEECGAEARNFFSLGKLYPSPGYCGEIIHMFAATGITYKTQHLDEGEFLEVIKLPFDEAVQMVMDGSITDAKSIAAILKLDNLRRGGKV